jgi:hypothetical protein
MYVCFYVCMYVICLRYVRTYVCRVGVPRPALCVVQVSSLRGGYEIIVSLTTAMVRTRAFVQRVQQVLKACMYVYVCMCIYILFICDVFIAFATMYVYVY